MFIRSLKSPASFMWAPTKTAEKIVKASPEQVAQAMRQVAKRTANKDLAARAEALAAPTRKP